MPIFMASHRSRFAGSKFAASGSRLFTALKRPGDIDRAIGLQVIPNFNVVVTCQFDAAFKSAAHFANVFLKALERIKLADYL